MEIYLMVDDDRVNPLTKHILALRDAAIKQYDDLYSSPRDQKIKRIATALCLSRHGGPPNDLTMGGATSYPEPTRAGNGAVAIVHPLQPAWATYVVDAHEALKAIEEAEKNGC